MPLKAAIIMSGMVAVAAFVECGKGVKRACVEKVWEVRVRRACVESGEGM